MVRTARIFNLFILVLSGAGALSAAFKSSSIPGFIGAVMGPIIILSPLWLSLLALGPIRPRVEKFALLSNKIFVFLLACGIVVIIFSLTDSHLGLPFLPLVVLLFIAAALNIAAINRQRKQRAVSAPNPPLNPDAPTSGAPVS